MMQQGKTVIIMGSSRSDGNTATISHRIANQFGYDVIDLKDYHISYYDYDNKNKDDDYLQLINTLVGKYDTFILSTPVYWYSMSGIMKVFFDRFTDLLNVEKDTGNNLRGKSMYVISNSTAKDLDFDFYLPFRRTANYLGIVYQGNQHFSEQDLQDTQQPITLNTIKH